MGLIDVTDGLVSIRSRGRATSAVVIFGENKPSGRLSYASELQLPGSCDVSQDAGDYCIDVKLDSTFQRMRVTSANEQAGFLAQVRRALTG